MLLSAAGIFHGALTGGRRDNSTIQYGRAFILSGSSLLLGTIQYGGAMIHGFPRANGAARMPRSVGRERGEKKKKKKKKRERGRERERERESPDAPLCGDRQTDECLNGGGIAVQRIRVCV